MNTTRRLLDALQKPLSLRSPPRAGQSFSPSGIEDTVFWRIHWLDTPPFSARNAWSVPWGQHGEEGAQPQRGYSAKDSPCGLLRYFQRHYGGIPGREVARVVVFVGNSVDSGPDLEPLVVPSRVIAWLDPAHLEEICRIEEQKSDEAVLGRVRELAEEIPSAAERAALKAHRAMEWDAKRKRDAAVQAAMEWAADQLFTLPVWSMDVPLSPADLFRVTQLVDLGADRGMAPWQLRELAKAAMVAARDRAPGTTVETSLGDLRHYIETSVRGNPDLLTTMELQSIFENERDRFVPMFPRTRLAHLVLVPGECFPGRPPCDPRDFAMASHESGQIEILEKILREPLDVVRGLLLHELGHIADPTPDASGAEQRADDLAERATGTRINYDERDLETVGRGRWPRPGYLPR